jgi:hypothetical protein
MLARWAILATAVVTISGCDSVSSTLGLERHVPDESQVVVRPALTLPPDYDLMPPGTATPVSSDHENGLSKGGQEISSDPSQQPKKEERGFFGRMFHWDLFGDDDIKSSPIGASSVNGPGPDINGTPQAPPPQPASPAAQAAPPGGAGPEINGTPQAPAKSSSLDQKMEMRLAMALMVDPDAASASPAAPAAKPKPDYIGDFFSDMGSLVGIQPAPKKPVQAAATQPSTGYQQASMSVASGAAAMPSGSPQQAPAQQAAAPRPAKRSPDYFGDFVSDMGSLVGLGGSKQQGGNDPTAK